MSCVVRALVSKRYTMPRTPQNRNASERFDPVPHTEVDTERLLADPLVKAEYAALEDEYAALRALLTARRNAGLTQAQLAKLVDTSQPVIARLEDADYYGRSLTLLHRIAMALGCTIELNFQKPQPKEKVSFV